MTTGELTFNGAGKAATTEARRALYDDALAIIRREFAADLRLADVARRIGASSRALQRAFAEHGELSFSEELRATRLNVAARLLRGTDLPVGAVARRVGYGDHAPFTKAFRRHHGMSPRAYAARGRSFGGNGEGTAVSARLHDHYELAYTDTGEDYDDHGSGDGHDVSGPTTTTP